MCCKDESLKAASQTFLKAIISTLYMFIISRGETSLINWAGLDKIWTGCKTTSFLVSTGMANWLACLALTVLTVVSKSEQVANKIWVRERDDLVGEPEEKGRVEGGDVIKVGDLETLDW